MLDDINGFFGDVTPQGAAVLLILGLFCGFGMHDVLVVLYDYVRNIPSDWYGGDHDDDDSQA